MIKVFHATNTTDDKASDYGFDSWIDYWKTTKQHHPRFTCPFCSKFPKKLVGAHVVSCKDWKTYIVPCCSDCNSKFTQNIDLKKEIVFFDIEEELLVQHPASFSKNKGIK